MLKYMYIRKKLASNWFSLLQQMICYEFEKIELEFARKAKKQPKNFVKKFWTKSKNKNQGGGYYSLIKNGLVFDSVGVNFSEVSGKFNKKTRLKIPGTKKNPNYWASGISVVAHPKNPKIPALHFNTRYIVTSHGWFGGGMDATPAMRDDKERKIFHKKIQETCDKYNKYYYKKYKKWCDNYFYLPHRKETRGIGGIFFDYKKDDWKKDFNFIRDLGLCFTYITNKIIRKKLYKKWSKAEKNKQLIKRGRYIEFNLLYDRGTKFGLQTGGNTDAILMSLPLEAKWY